MNRELILTGPGAVAWRDALEKLTVTQAGNCIKIAKKGWAE